MGLENFLNEQITEEDSFLFTLPEILQLRAEHTPDQTAYIFLRDGENEEEKITYKELDEEAGIIAQSLRRRNLRGERALMLYPPGLEFVKALYGCFYAGVIAVPAYPPRKNRSLERIRLMVADSGASIVLTTNDIHQSFERSFSDVEELKKLTWLSTYEPSLPAPQLPGFPAPAPSDIALLQYTSGSTGNPKGVMVTHRNIMRNVEYIRQSFELSRQSVSVTWLPSFHDMGLIDGVIEPVYTGFPGVIIPPVSFLQKPVRWLKAITKYKGTHGGAPNFAFDFCVDGISGEEKQDIDLSTMKTLYCGAEPIRKSSFEKFIHAYKDHGFTASQLYPCYGMAETTLIISGPHAGRGPVYLYASGHELENNKIITTDNKAPDCRHLVGVGYPWIDTDVRIVNPESFDLSKENEVGEIWVSGSIVTAGYWNKKEETGNTYSAVINGNPEKKYLRTGDLGFFHEGELYISGRLKDLIIINGRNFYPQDIEFAVESSHPSIRKGASAAFPIVKDGLEKMVVVAEVERAALRDLDVHEVCDAIRHKISELNEFAVYAIILIRTASILKTSSGKIQRKACKEAFLQNALDIVGESYLEKMFHAEEQVEIVTDIVSIQAWLMVWIHEKLKIPLDRIDMSKPITVYGLSSMKAVQLQQDFLNMYDVEFPPYLFFEKIPVKELCVRAYNLITEK